MGDPSPPDDISNHPDLPKRDHLDEQGITWRHGSPPDYTKVNRLYLAERTRKHAPDSLEKVVENLVKTWEFEASHKTVPKDWRTVNPDKYVISANHGKKFNMAEVIDRGTYNMLMNDSPVYDAASQTFDSSHNLFKGAFPEGFAWELLDLYSGPPNVAFTWRHWAQWSGPYGTRKPTGETMELFGACVVKVDDKLKIEEIKVYYDPNPFIAKMAGMGPGQATEAWEARPAHPPAEAHAPRSGACRIM